MKFKLAILTILLTVLLNSASSAAAPQPAAMVTNAAGEAYLIREEAPSRVKLELAAYLFAGDKVELGPRGAVTLAYFKGCRQDFIQGPGMVLVTADKTRALKQTTISSTPLKKCGPPPQVALTDESSVAKGVVRMRGMVGSLSPSETKVASVNPTLRWSTARSVLPQHFLLALYDKGLNKLWESRVEMTTWGALETRYPDSAPPLKPGEMYRWSVNNSVAYFAVATPEEIKILEGKQKAYEPLTGPPGKDLTYLLFSALLYEEAGFNADAAEYYRRVLKLAPRSRQVHLRLAEIFARMNWGPEAESELEEAKNAGNRE